jgi:hypothetical protein
MDSTISASLAIGSIVISVIGSMIALVNHKRIRSNCCGKRTEVSLDIEETTPTDKTKTESFVPTS